MISVTVKKYKINRKGMSMGRLRIDPNEFRILIQYSKVFVKIRLVVFTVLFICIVRRSKRKEEKLKNNMVQLEVLDKYNRTQLINLDRKDIPLKYVAEIEHTISLADYGAKFGLGGRCFAIKYGGKYVGIILIGEAVKNEADPVELKGEKYFRILEFLIDNKYQGMGIGTIALNKAISAVRREYGRIPLLLECHKDNERAIRFYEENGFKNTGKLNEKGTDWFMVKK